MRFSQAKGHQVVSTNDADTIGKVDGFVVDTGTAKVVALHLKKTPGDGDLLSWADLKAFGTDAVTVESASLLAKASDAAKGQDVVGSRILTEDGEELGEVKDVEFDTADGSVTALVTKNGDEVEGIRMIGLGSYALIVKRV